METIGTFASGIAHNFNNIVATARIIVRQARIAEHTLPKFDLPGVDRGKLGNGSDRFFGNGAVGFGRLRSYRRKLQAAQDQYADRDCAKSVAGDGRDPGSIAKGQLMWKSSEQHIQEASVRTEISCSRHWSRRFVPVCVITVFMPTEKFLRTNKRPIAWMTPIPAT